MAEFPFQLSIKRFSSDKEQELVTCTSVLRSIPHRRDVYDAIWNDKPVVVKTFSDKISAKRHLIREWRGLNLQQERGLSSPTPLFYGRTDDGRWAVVLEKIVDSLTVWDVYHNTTDAAKKLDLLILVCKELANRHEKRALQKDLHLGNFLLCKGKLVATDPAQMRFFRHKIGRKKAISQIASLGCALPDTDVEAADRLCKEYAHERKWRLTDTDMLFFRKQLSTYRRKAIKTGLKKCLRTSRRYVRITAGTYGGVFSRAFCQQAETFDLISQIDELMDRGKILKKGNTSYVSRVIWNGKDIVIKRYNHKGFIHSLRQTIKRSRARRSWLHAHRLQMLDVATPKPLAYIECHWAGVVWKSYFMTEYIQAQNLHSFLSDRNVTDRQRSKAIDQIRKLVKQLGRYRITHGDLKHSNILVTEKGPVLTDLDAMKVHKLIWLYEVTRRKDVMRFAD